MGKIEKASAGMAAIVVIVIALGIIGYIRGIVKFVKCDFETPYKAEVIYGVGTFTGLGAIIGWVDIEDGTKEKSPEVNP